MNDSTPERLLVEEPPFRERRWDSLPCMFLDGRNMGSLELRGLGALLKKQAMYSVSLDRTDPAEWAAQTQAYYDQNEKMLGGHPHDIVILENARTFLGRTIAGRDRHLAFVVRSDYNPVIPYLDHP